ncbi:Flp family type IVb pilin [Aeromicrobium sp. 179-A 4D2 NHS]|uniref:Flp family type IVb pilin n=1 Tax=Aeromicrobium sp. 179-A 4D2 NHS TaxID=3142375 RepID=UPI0039A3BC37
MTWWRTWAQARRMERGTSATEYALLISGVAIGIVVLVVMFGDSLATNWLGFANVL